MTPQKRKRVNINDHSYIESYCDEEPRNFLLFIHGIFGNYEESWCKTPETLITSRTFFEFDYGSFGYKSSIIDFSDPKEEVDQFILWCKTHLLKYENIFVVAHSMGGVIVRHACAQLLNSSKEEEIQLLKKIRLCFLLAVPLSGSWVAKLLNIIPLVRKVNKRIPYLAKPRIESSDLSKVYNEALQNYVKSRDISAKLSDSIPTFHIFVGTEDKIVSRPKEWAMANMDKYEGPVPGSHSSFIEDADVNSTLTSRITQLIAETISRSPKIQSEKIELVRKTIQIREKETTLHGGVLPEIKDDGTDIILISCSSHKRDGNNILHPNCPGIADKVSNKTVGDFIIQTRLKILNMIQSGRIDGIEFQEGNRASRPENRELYLGPDFGGVINQEKYLPAYLRYHGRCYQATEDEWKAFYEAPTKPHILIMSGLYGLPTGDEYIQNYDCHLTDVDLVTGFSIQSYWKDREFMTQILISHIEWVENNEGPVSKIIDLLSELSYQETINWNMIYPRWPVCHRVFESTAGRKSLENIGVWVQDVIRSPSQNMPLEHDKFYENKDFFTPDRIAFESRIGLSPLKVAREDEDSKSNDGSGYCPALLEKTQEKPAETEQDEKNTKGDLGNTTKHTAITKYERYIRYFKENKVISIFILVAVIIIAFGTVTTALKEIRDFWFKPNSSAKNEMNVSPTSDKITVASATVEVKITSDWDFNGRVANIEAYLAFVKDDKPLLITSSIGYTASQTGNNEVVYKAKLDMDAKDPAVGNPTSFLKDTEYIQIEFGKMPSDSFVLEGDAICIINNSVRLKFLIPAQKLVNNRIYIRDPSESLQVLNETRN